MEVFDFKSLLKTVDDIVVVSLEDRPDRREVFDSRWAGVCNYRYYLAEKMTKDKQLKAEIREKKKKKKGKKAELLVEEQKDFKFHDVVSTDELLQMLYKGGYMDTINDVFSDNNNSLFIISVVFGVKNNQLLFI